MRFIALKKASTKRVISSFLVLALLSLALFNSHYHLHHEDPSSVHGPVVGSHVLELHSVMDLQDADHHLNSPDMHFVDVDNGIGLGFKSSITQLPLVGLLLTLILVLPLSQRLAHLGFRPTALKLPRHVRHKTPPPRAPPRR